MPQPARDPAEPSPDFLRALAQHREDLAGLIDELHRPVTDEGTLLDQLHRVSREAVRRIGGVQWAGVTAQFAGAPFTAANTDATMLIVDEAQYGQGDGPCLRAMLTDQVVAMTDQEVTDRWPLLAAATATVGVRGFYAEPLHAQGRAVGAFNLYSATQGGLRGLDRDLLIVLTGYLDRALTDYAAAHFGKLDSRRLQTTLHRRRIINHAVGTLMATHGIGGAEAQRALYLRAPDESLVEQFARQVFTSRVRHADQDNDTWAGGAAPDPL